MDSELGRRIGALSPAKRALFEARLRRVEAELSRAEPKNHRPQPQVKSGGGGGANLVRDTGSLGRRRPIDFSLFFFSDTEGGDNSAKYDTLINCAKYADDNGFASVWTPERHFKSFGGLYPNPSVLGAALAVATTRIGIRAGSVVLPLHHPLRVAEEWSAVDNLSRGRVGISIASGWHPDDFALSPERFDKRREITVEMIDIIRRLWQGEAMDCQNGVGNPAAVRTYPHPVQTRLPIWLTSLSERSFIEAGRLGANVLTGLMEQHVAECGRKIALYRQSLAEHGFDPNGGRVTLMVHTYVGSDDGAVRALVRQPMINYLHSFLQQSEMQLRADARIGAVIPSELAEDRDALLEQAFERYFSTRSLMGTVETCVASARQLAAIGVDELACLLDFGLDGNTITEGLQHLNLLRRAVQSEAVSQVSEAVSQVSDHAPA